MRSPDTPVLQTLQRSPRRFSLHLVLVSFFCLLVSIPPSPLVAQDDEEQDTPPALNSSALSGLALRNIGPAFMSGRIIDIAVHPVKRNIWYVAAASGNVWKTTNAGTTWDPVFDKYGSYSIGCITIDEKNPLVIWIGTGENNSQRSVGYGDGVYKSIDGGRTFKNVGLKKSEHIGKILIDPRNSNVVYVASQGPLWAPGGDRGLFKTTDGGATWKTILEISENTGISEVHFDPRDADVLYAVAYQRRRHVWTLLNGGPESGIHKSTDGGGTWRTINSGLPTGDKGRIGMTVSTMRPDVVYAIVEATGDKGGFFRSENGGEHWNKMSDYVSGSPQYYNEIFADPHVFDRIYSMDTWSMVSEDGGKTFQRLGDKYKHVDNHAIVFDPADPDHLLIGCDGGLYETWDRGQTYDFKSNLPITQFYKVAVSNEQPFYYVYGGTQDNATQGGPSRTTNVHGIRNSDWFVTVFGDGFDPAVDPDNPNIVYSQWQYGGLIRYDRNTGERIDIKPQPEKDGPPLRWNWDSALMISPHSPTRLYYASQILFRSDDRGDTWRAVSPDLTRNLDRNKLPIMGRVWSVDAVAKNNSTSFYGTIVALTESPLVEGLLYAGTDDGLIQVTEDGGASWRKIERLPDVPEMTYVNDLEASLHDPNTVYAVLNNHKQGDFKPYVLMSEDRGKSWKGISGDLPERGSTYAIVQDHVKKDLLFVGTEFGIFCTLDGGKKWIQLKGGMPTIAVRDLEIQRRENDLVAASFGRGFFILDDYTPLRQMNDQLVQSNAHLFPTKTALMYIQDRPLAGDEKAYQGAGFYTAPNPPFGATFTYYLKESLKTRRAVREDQEEKLAKDGKDIFYPPWDQLKAEDREEDPAILLTIRDEAGSVVRRLNGKTSKGIHRVTWDFRYPGFSPLGLSGDGFGPMALPGKYQISIEKRIDGVTTQLISTTPFDVEALGMSSLGPTDRGALLAFQKEVGALQRAVVGASHATDEAITRVNHMKHAIQVSPNIDPALREDAHTLLVRLTDFREALRGDPTKPRRSEPELPGILDRIQQIVYGHWSSTSPPTATHRRNYEIASEQYGALVTDLKQLVEVDLVALESRLEAAGVPWTPGRGIPDWPSTQR